MWQVERGFLADHAPHSRVTQKDWRPAPQVDAHQSQDSLLGSFMQSRGGVATWGDKLDDFIVSGSFWTFHRVLLLPSLDRWRSLSWLDRVYFFPQPLVPGLLSWELLFGFLSLPQARLP